MFGRPHPVRYAGKFQFGLKDAGNFPSKPRSIFHDKDKIVAETADTSDDIGNDGDEMQFVISRPSLNTETKRAGRIQFEGIVIPPSAPKDLICEECEKRSACLYCSACEEVFCVECADLAHPRVSHNDLMHQHEKDGKIRALQFGDTSKIKKEIVPVFYLPDEELQMEDYMKIKDLSKPNSLSTGTDAKKLKPSVEKRRPPSFKVNDMVLFKDPVTKRDAYGQIVSEWDQRHGTAAMPAILRGEDSIVYYLVQQHGQLVDVENLMDLVPGLQEKFDAKTDIASNESVLAENSEEIIISDLNNSHISLSGADKNVPLRKEYEIAHSVNKRLKDLQNILSLGPKFHLRDLRDPKNVIAKQLHPEAFHSDNHSHYSIDQSVIASTLPNPLTTLPSIASKTYKSHISSQQLNSNFSVIMDGNESLEGSSTNLLLRRDITSPGKVSIAGDRSALDYKPKLPVLQQYHEDSLQQEQQIIQKSKQPTYEQVDLNLYANIDGDSQSMLSYYNPHYKPLPAPQRSYEDLLRSQQTFPIDKSLQNSLRVNQDLDHHHHHHDKFDLTDRYSNGSKEPPAWTTFLVVAEKDLESLHDHIERIERRKRQLLKRIFNRQDYLWMKLQLHRKFRYWKNNLKAIWIQKRHICATKIQSRARVWLCREKLNELREYWASIYEAKRRAVHAQFRFSHRGDKYACTYDNKKFFATQADLNRYCRFLALMLSRITRFMNRKRLRLLGKTIVVWKSAIYDFVESTLQNEHIDMQLVAFDQQQHGPFSIAIEKQKMIETFQMLLQSLPMGAREPQGDMDVFLQSDQKSESLWYDNRQHNTVSSWPLRVEPPLSFFDTHRSVAAAAGNGDAHQSALEARYQEIVPPYDPATLMPYLPELPRIQRPPTFKERLQQDLAAAINHGKAHRMTAEEAAALTIEGRIPMAGVVSHSYWMLPQVLMVGDAPFGPAHVTAWKQVPTYELFDDKRIYFNEPFPIELQYPYESGCNGFLKDEDIEIVGGVTLIKRNKQRAIQRQQEAIQKKMTLMASNSLSLQKAPREKEVLSAITQLLMSGVDTFVSLLSEEQEKLVQEYYQSPPVEKLIDEAMEKAQLSANRIIVDNQSIIHKQEAHLEQIPNYGKTDPRYPQAFREKLRCQARIALAESNIARIRQQVKNIPKNGIKFHRLSVMKHPYPWTVDHVLPSIWQLEKIIAETMSNVDPSTKLHGKIYFYGGGLACDEDGPVRDGRAGLIMAMIIGRLYHVDPSEALYRWQKAHDCMPALKYMKLTATSSNTTYLTNCPPLPWERNLLFDVLKRSHLPLDYPTIRIQLEPDRFQDLRRNHYDESLRYQVGIVQAALENQDNDGNNKPRSKTPPFKVPGIKVRSNAGAVSSSKTSTTSTATADDEADKGYSVAYMEAERQEAILRSGQERQKQSQYFHQELIWPPLSTTVTSNETKPAVGPDFSRKHRSAIVLPSKASHREAESRKQQRKAAKREARSAKLALGGSLSNSNSLDDGDMSDYDLSEDSASLMSLDLSEKGHSFHSIGHPHSGSHHSLLSLSQRPIGQGTENISKGNDNADLSHATAIVHGKDSSFLLHALSPTKELLEEDDA